VPKNAALTKAAAGNAASEKASAPKATSGKEVRSMVLACPEYNMKRLTVWEPTMTLKPTHLRRIDLSTSKEPTRSRTHPSAMTSLARGVTTKSSNYRRPMNVNRDS
jgi:hypothetical protein